MLRWCKSNRLLTFVLSLLLAAPIQAGGEEFPAQKPLETYAPPSLKPFKAYYQAQFDLGISVSGEAIRELKALDNGQWLLSMNANTMMASIEESSLFEILQQQIRPLQYDYKRKVFSKKKSSQQRFDWPNGTLLSSAKERSTRLQIDQQTHDKVSYQLQLWNDLKSGLNQMHYTLADGDRLKDLVFNRISEETVTTPAGRFETIKVVRDRGAGSARTTTLWFAKDLDHVIVKLEQIETDGKQYILLLQRLETP